MFDLAKKLLEHLQTYGKTYPNNMALLKEANQLTTGISQCRNNCAVLKYLQELNAQPTDNGQREYLIQCLTNNTFSFYAVPSETFTANLTVQKKLEILMAKLNEQQTIIDNLITLKIFNHHFEHTLPLETLCLITVLSTCVHDQPYPWLQSDKNTYLAHTLPRLFTLPIEQRVKYIALAEYDFKSKRL